MSHPPEQHVFPWYDEYYLKDAHPDPLAVAARALVLMDDLQATAREYGDVNSWIVYGLSVTARALIESDNAHALGVLLTGLETILPEARRDNWPLHYMVMDQRSPKQKKRRLRRVEPQEPIELKPEQEQTDAV